MRTGEHQGEAAVGNLSVGVRRFEDFADLLQVEIDGIASALFSHHIDELAPCHGEEPCLRVRWAAATRPVGQRCCEGFGKRVLGSGYVVRARGEEGDKLAVAAARYSFCCAVSLGVLKLVEKLGLFHARRRDRG